MRVGTVAIIIDALGPPVQVKVWLVEVGIGNPWLKDRFVGVKGIAGYPKQPVAGLVSDIGALERNLIG